MRVTLEPTQELHTQKLPDGREVPLRVWVGHTDGGVEVHVFVFAITPADPALAPRLDQEIPMFMKRTRDMYES